MWDHWGKTWKPSPANLSASALYTSTCATCFYTARSQAQRLPWWFKDSVRWQRICEGPNKDRADLELSVIQCHGLMHLVRMSMTFLRFLDICWWIIFGATPELVTVAFPEFSSLSVKGIFLGKLCVFLLVECVAPKVVTDIRCACKLLARSRRTPPCLMSWVPTQPTPQSSLFESFALHMSISYKDTVCSCLFSMVGKAGLSCNAFALGVSHIMEVRMLLSRDMISWICSGQ